MFSAMQADEYDCCFLGLSPSIAVVTNVEWDHVDIFQNEVCLDTLLFIKDMRMNTGSNFWFLALYVPSPSAQGLELVMGEVFSLLSLSTSFIFIGIHTMQALPLFRRWSFIAHAPILVLH